MARLEIIPEVAALSVIVLRVSDESGREVASVDLTPELLEQTFAHLLAAWSVMDKGVGVPGEVGTWTDGPAIEGADWEVGARPLDGAVTLGLCPARIGDRELWLTYGFPRHQAEKLRDVIGLALERAVVQGSA